MDGLRRNRIRGKGNAAIASAVGSRRRPGIVESESKKVNSRSDFSAFQFDLQVRRISTDRVFERRRIHPLVEIGNRPVLQLALVGEHRIHAFLVLSIGRIWHRTFGHQNNAITGTASRLGLPRQAQRELPVVIRRTRRGEVAVQSWGHGNEHQTCVREWLAIERHRTTRLDDIGSLLFATRQAAGH